MTHRPIAYPAVKDKVNSPDATFSGCRSSNCRCRWFLCNAVKRITDEHRLDIIARSFVGPCLVGVCCAMLSAVTDYSFPYQNNDHASLTARHKNSVNISPLGQCFHVWTLLRCTVRVCSSARPRQYDRYDVRNEPRVGLA